MGEKIVLGLSGGVDSAVAAKLLQEHYDVTGLYLDIRLGESGAADAGGEEYVSVQVTTGVSDGSYIEITSGLQEGDTVVYIPTTSSDSDMGMMGGMPGGGGGGMGGGPGGF